MLSPSASFHGVLVAAAAGWLGLASCAHRDAPAAPTAPPGGADTVAATAVRWQPGTLPATGAPASLIVPAAQLTPLRVRRTGPAVFKSNNPEIFTGAGWLMQNAGTGRGTARGGRAMPLTGKNVIYLFHINRSGAAKYVHVLAAAAGPAATRVAYRGACFTNATYPLTGAATGQSYHVAKAWLTGDLPLSGTTPDLTPGALHELVKVRMNQANMIDGRLEVTSTQPTLYYVVATDNGTPAEAQAAAQGAFVSGKFYPEDRNRFGREAGLYATSEATAAHTLDLPAETAYAGFCLNTTNKFVPALEDQTADSLMTLRTAASRTYGNYGHCYRLTFTLRNPGRAARRVQAYFASNATDPARPNATWNGPIRCDNTVFDVYTTFSAPRVPLSAWSVPAGGRLSATVEFYVPGLITTNQQLILQAD